MKHKHEWLAFSTMLATSELMLRCECGKYAVIPDPSKAEWGEAFHAPSNNYAWDDLSRVVIKEEWKVVPHPVYDIWTITRSDHG